MEYDLALLVLKLTQREFEHFRLGSNYKGSPIFVSFFTSNLAVSPDPDLIILKTVPLLEQEGWIRGTAYLHGKHGKIKNLEVHVRIRTHDGNILREVCFSKDLPTKGSAIYSTRDFPKELLDVVASYQEKVMG